MPNSTPGRTPLQLLIDEFLEEERIQPWQLLRTGEVKGLLERFGNLVLSGSKPSKPPFEDEIKTKH